MWVTYLTLGANTWFRCEAPVKVTPYCYTVFLPCVSFLAGQMPYVFRLSDLPKLDFDVDRGTDFTAWTAQWTSYSTLSGLSEEPAATKVQALTLCFSRETLTVVDNLGLTTEERNDSSAIIAALKRHVEGHINESMERRRRSRRMQQPGESFDDYLVSLRELVKTCNFCSAACSQKSIRDQIIEGLIDGDTVEYLLRQQDLTLDNAIAICRAQEAAKKQRKDISDNPVLTIQRIIKQHAHYKSPQASQSVLKSCPGCGAQAHQGGRAQCPAFKQTCRFCLKVGHFARACHSRQPPQKHPRQKYPAAKAITAEEDEVDQETTSMTVLSVKQVATIDPAPTIMVEVSTIHGSVCTAILPDSGADISAAGENILPPLNEYKENLLPSEFRPRVANGQRMCPIGKMCVHFQLAGKEHKEDMYIFPTLDGVIMSWKAAKALNVMPPHYPLPSPSTAPPRPQVSKPPTSLMPHRRWTP